MEVLSTYTTPTVGLMGLGLWRPTAKGILRFILRGSIWFCSQTSVRGDGVLLADKEDGILKEELKFRGNIQ